MSFRATLNLAHRLGRGAVKDKQPSAGTQMQPSAPAAHWVDRGRKSSNKLSGKRAKLPRVKNDEKIPYSTPDNTLPEEVTAPQIRSLPEEVRALKNNGAKIPREQRGDPAVLQIGSLLPSLTQRRKAFGIQSPKETHPNWDQVAVIKGKGDKNLINAQAKEHRFAKHPPPTTAEVNKANAIFGSGLYKRKPTYPEGMNDIHRLALPDIVFVGRGNVGKSTMMNVLTRTRRVVQVSKSPGHTKKLAFLDIGGKFNIVDTPGFGHNSQREWGEFLMRYFSDRDKIKRCMFLVDVRRGILDVDKQAIDILAKYCIPYQIVLTKTDCMNPFNLAVRVKDIELWLSRHSNGTLVPRILLTSAKENKGLDTLRVACLEACDILK